MKHYANILLAVLLTAGLATANTPSQVDYTFTIHIGAFVNAKLADFENIRPYGYIYAQKLNNLDQVYMGNYPSEPDAQKVLSQVKTNGYPDAFVTRRNLETGTIISVIQLGTETLGANIDWEGYMKAGPLHAFQYGKRIKIVTGPFDNLDDAQSRLTLIKRLGFNDAFIKDMNSVLLHKVTSFETGGLNVPDSFEAIILPEETPDEEVVIAEIPPKKSNMPDVMVRKKGAAEKSDPRDEPRPTTYEKVVTPKSLPTTTSTPKTKVKKKITSNTNTLAVPNIRPKVKRTSVLKLQEVLKMSGAYTGSLDGFYGAGTKTGFQKIMADNKEVKKYKLLAQMYEEESKASPIQQVINDMNDDVAVGVSKLKTYKSPLAKAYQAYGVFKLSGKNQKTDQLMNQAIKESFSNNKMKNKAPFDYKAKYSYSNYGQLIKHLRYIHGAAQEDIVVPCWLFEQHMKEAILAFEPHNELTSGDYKIQDCGNIMNWESLSLLETIMKEMTPSLADLDQKNMAKLQSKRAGFMLSPKAQSAEDYKKVDTWNTKLWNGLNSWATADPLHAKMVTPLKLAYFQSWALLEDHFMNKGLSAREARGVSLAVLQTITTPYLERYSE